MIHASCVCFAETIKVVAVLDPGEVASSPSTDCSFVFSFFAVCRAQRRRPQRARREPEGVHPLHIESLM